MPGLCLLFSFFPLFLPFFPLDNQRVGNEVTRSERRRRRIEVLTKKKKKKKKSHTRVDTHTHTLAEQQVSVKLYNTKLTLQFFVLCVTSEKKGSFFCCTKFTALHRRYITLVGKTPCTTLIHQDKSVSFSSSFKGKL